MWRVEVAGDVFVVDGVELVDVPDIEKFNDWLSLWDGAVPWSPTGPWVGLPPSSDPAAYAVVISYVEDVYPGERWTTSGDVPDVSELWLAPGEVEEPDRVY